MGTWPIYKKHFLQLILTKNNNFHLIKYFLATFIFFPFFSISTCSRSDLCHHFHCICSSTQLCWSNVSHKSSSKTLASLFINQSFFAYWWYQIRFRRSGGIINGRQGLSIYHTDSTSPFIPQGTIAYAAQQAWVQNATLKNNILFHSDFEEEKYEKVLDNCCLRADIAILPGADTTEIGEKVNRPQVFLVTLLKWSTISNLSQIYRTSNNAKQAVMGFSNPFPFVIHACLKHHGIPPIISLKSQHI